MSASTTNGSFSVNEIYTITGNVEYWNAGTAVEGAWLTLSGDQSSSIQSDQAGAYSFTLEPGDYTVTPGKVDDIDGISAYDASLVLQHTVNSITLSGYAAQAADVNKTTTITPMDAVYILQKSVNSITLPFPGASAVWEFDTTEHSYSPLNSDQTNQDFTAILLGDVSGNWNGSAAMQPPESPARSGETAPVVLEQRTDNAQRIITTTVKWQAADRDLYGLDLIVSYDPTQVAGAELQALASDVAFEHHISEPGILRIGIASEQPIASGTDLLAIQFQQADEGNLNLSGSAQVNEQPAAVTVTETSSGSRVYLPSVRR
jgi:hypothetical protein